MSLSRLRYGDMLRVIRSHSLDRGSPSVPGLVERGCASVFPTNCVESNFYCGSELWDGRYIFTNRKRYCYEAVRLARLLEAVLSATANELGEQERVIAKSTGRPWSTECSWMRHVECALAAAARIPQNCVTANVRGFDYDCCCSHRLVSLASGRLPLKGSTSPRDAVERLHLELKPPCSRVKGRQ